MEIIRKNLQRYSPISKDDNLVSICNKICVLLLVLCPILQHYKAFFDNAGTVTMIFAFSCVGINLLTKQYWNIGAVLPLIIFSVYETINHGVEISELARELLLLGYFVAAASHAMDLKFFKNAATSIAVAACLLIILQYVCYYIAGFHLQLVADGWLAARAEQWIQLVQTGRISASGKPMAFYRPSAFFLEPSHMMLFCFPVMVSALFEKNQSRRSLVVALVVSLGIMLSTSGMGMVLVFGCWGVTILKRLTGGGNGLVEKIKSLMRPKNLKWLGLALGAVVLLFLCVEPFRMSIVRIFYNPDGKTAIGGRVGTGFRAISYLSGIERWLGKQNWGNVHKWNMTGFAYTMYTQGIVGMVLSYVFYVRSLWKAKYAGFWIALILLGLSFLTLHTHAAFYMMYYVMFLLGNYDLDEDQMKIKNVFRPILCKLKNTFNRSAKV